MIIVTSFWKQSVMEIVIRWQASSDEHENQEPWRWPPSEHKAYPSIKTAIGEVITSVITMFPAETTALRNFRYSVFDWTNIFRASREPTRNTIISWISTRIVELICAVFNNGYNEKDQCKYRPVNVANYDTDNPDIDKWTRNKFRVSSRFHSTLL